jgi:large subunit ribosomal protein L25
MNSTIGLTLQDREAVGKGISALRKQGWVPGVVYGQDFAATSVMAEQIPLTKVYRAAGKHHPIELQIGKQKKLAMIKAVDVDPIKRTLRHVSFHVIKQNEAVETEIPITISGEGGTPAERAGLVVLSTIEAVEVSALPAKLPDTLVAPGEKLVEAGDKLTVADLVVPEGVTILSDPEQVVASVYEPAALEAQNAASGGMATEEAPAEPTEGEEEPDEVEEKAKPTTE